MDFKRVKEEEKGGRNRVMGIEGVKKGQQKENKESKRE